MFILGIRKETDTAIIFDVEHMEKETLHVMEINKDVLSKFFDEKTPQSDWLDDDKFAERLEDAAFWIKNNECDNCYFRDATPNTYRIFYKSGGSSLVCMGQIPNIEKFMKDNNCTKFETFFKL